MNAITIDGPAASGKSSVGYEAARRLDFLFFDTGILYRAVTWQVLQQGIGVTDRDAVGQVAEETRIDITPARERTPRRTPGNCCNRRQ